MPGHKSPNYKSLKWNINIGNRQNIIKNVKNMTKNVIYTTAPPKIWHNIMDMKEIEK